MSKLEAHYGKADFHSESARQDSGPPNFWLIDTEL